MPVLFDADDAESDEELKVNKDYATNYDNWRQKEELNKLKTKYGDISGDAPSDDSESSSEDEDEDGDVVQFDKEFYKTLACLKKKDPRIYDGKTSFFQSDTKEDDKNKKKQSKKEKALSLRDYECKLTLERDGKLSDSEDKETFKQKIDSANAPIYVEGQRQTNKTIKSILNDIDDEEEDTGLSKAEEKTEAEKQQEQRYKEWLKGQKLEIDETEQKELEPLRDYWNDPNLDANERFLRDYILNDKFRDKDFLDSYNEQDQRIHDSDENLSADEETIEKQEEFEHKYNFRFEEPDKEFIKRYPRTMENSMRKKDTRRAQKRQELKKRKEEEKIRKQEELKQLKALKKKEIQEKIEKIKEVTGNDDVTFNDIDLDADFDPAEHDRKMTEMFNDTYYAAPEEDEKPEFPEIDEELEIERTWDNCDLNDIAGSSYDNDDAPHCEDEDFNMDADYCESQATSSQIVEGPKRKRKKRSKFAELIAKKKPKYDPSEHPSYQDYFDRYYSLDYEDMIGDLPCRFKYRQVVPNDYGLTVEEILMADDKELNRWCSLKRALRYKSEHVELNDLQVYKRKGSNEELKRKILTSLYTTPGKEDNPQENGQSMQEEPKKKKRRRKKAAGDQNTENSAQKNDDNDTIANNENKQAREVKSSDKSMSKESTSQRENTMETDKPSTEIKSKRKKRPIDDREDQKQTKRLKTENNDDHETQTKKNKMDKKTETVNTNSTDSDRKQANGTTESVVNKKNKKNKFGKKDKKQKNQTKQKTLSEDVKQVMSIHPERLKGYGINAKKFKNKLLYKKDNK